MGYIFRLSEVRTKAKSQLIHISQDHHGRNRINNIQKTHARISINAISPSQIQGQGYRNLCHYIKFGKDGRRFSNGRDYRMIRTKVVTDIRKEQKKLLTNEM